jgi:hypothetical protein
MRKVATVVVVVVTVDVASDVVNICICKQVLELSVPLASHLRSMNRWPIPAYKMTSLDGGTARFC